ncbi:hypothetical protein NDU88_000919 [Pleurodeles waltl]|uniref:Uncharacterized protein n=1 Tax=Pleurodeles waltl TaxID=8319 RepID=A0AAV7WKN6_PLEWA|nr:hypothetical protein NDU88_000919 [Pleurodeles waltl]
MPARLGTGHRCGGISLAAEVGVHLIQTREHEAEGAWARVASLVSVLGVRLGLIRVAGVCGLDVFPSYSDTNGYSRGVPAHMTTRFIQRLLPEGIVLQSL